MVHWIHLSWYTGSLVHSKQLVYMMQLGSLLANLATLVQWENLYLVNYHKTFFFSFFFTLVHSNHVFILDAFGSLEGFGTIDALNSLNLLHWFTQRSLEYDTLGPLQKLLTLYMNILSVYNTAPHTELPYTQLSLLMFKFSVKSRCLAAGEVLTVRAPP